MESVMHVFWVCVNFYRGGWMFTGWTTGFRHSESGLCGKKKSKMKPPFDWGHLRPNSHSTRSKFLLCRVLKLIHTLLFIIRRTCNCVFWFSQNWLNARSNDCVFRCARLTWTFSVSQRNNRRHLPLVQFVRSTIDPSTPLLHSLLLVTPPIVCYLFVMVYARFLTILYLLCFLSLFQC